MASVAADGSSPIALARRAVRLIRAYRDPQRARVKPWFAANGDRTLRLDYDLIPDSVVFDVGGFEGNWASDIFAMYQSTIHVFEPVGTFHEAIAVRFRRNAKIHVHPFGLADHDGQTRISLESDRSSVHRAGAGERAELRSFAGFLEQQRINHIDLLKINIEGGEYELLEHILDQDLQGRIVDIQVQFHQLGPASAARMQAIQERLRRTHEPTYRYEFVWENWHLRD